MKSLRTSAKAAWARCGARDSRLGGDVAIKSSAQQFSDRFEREARAIAALNHPNICTLFDVGPNYLVMELKALRWRSESRKAPFPWMKRWASPGKSRMHSKPLMRMASSIAI
ncbi:MAG TPA: hypothetical protein VG273_12555 [Bryobacteraceae bacterium]|jgi:hypothetical protein|nr:hypothetical protein [Bryobacteraceae bacterium]